MLKVHKLSTVLGTEASSNLVSTPGFIECTYGGKGALTQHYSWNKSFMKPCVNSHLLTTKDDTVMDIMV